MSNIIGLLGVDTKKYPNLALMKLSAYHKLKGDTVELFNPLNRYDKVYISKIFSFTPDYEGDILSDVVDKGGSGYGEYGKNLPNEIEHICPDYDLYPEFEHAYGFTTRGCVNKCGFCIVPQKEGGIHAHADIEEFLGLKKTLVLMDNNIIAHPHGLEQLKKNNRS
ncbi:MAG: hypothetical protein ACRC6V_05195 [Bacteroidales bacterium]